MATQKANTNFFILLLVLVSIGFFTVILPFYGAIFWAVIFAVIFKPFHNIILNWMPKRRNTASLITLIVCVTLGIIPMILIILALFKEIIALYRRIDSGQINFSDYIEKMTASLPAQSTEILSFFNLDDLSELQKQIQEIASQTSKFMANQAVSVGQDAFQFFISFGIMVYLLFFLFRDGPLLAEKIKQCLPLSQDYRNHLFDKFITVVKATVKGNVLIAAIQGMLGGLIFYFLGIQGPLLWGVLMGFLSLLPAIGAALIWFPVAVYFLANGDVSSGIILMLYGFIVIGFADNVLRPILVGKSTRLPDYIILISTIGGLTVFGPNGFVVGPLLAALFIACWQLFSETNKEKEAEEKRLIKMKELEEKSHLDQS